MKLTIKGKMGQFMRFFVVGGFGTVLNSAVLYSLVHFAQLYYLIASVIAIEAAIISNFVGNSFFTFREKNNGNLKKRFLKFQMFSISTVFGTLFILWALTTLLGQDHLLIWNLISIGIMFLMNFFLNSRFTWKDKK